MTSAERGRAENQAEKRSIRQATGYGVRRNPSPIKTSFAPVITALSSADEAGCGRHRKQEQAGHDAGVSTEGLGDQSSQANQSGQSKQSAQPTRTTFEFVTVNLSCPHCSGLIVEEIRALPWVEDVSFSLTAERLVLTAGSRPDRDPLDAVLEIIARHEPDAGAAYARKNVPAERDAGSETFGGAVYEFATVNLTCPHCSGLIVEEIRALPWVKDVSFSLTAERLILTACAKPDLDPLDAVLAIIARHEPDAGAVYSRKETSSPDASVAGDRGCKSRQEQTTNSEKPKLDPLLKTAIAI